jgi:pSer/pThr/pTyr-binding forkhead associated (FHA) protein
MVAAAPFGPHRASPAELKDQLAAERRGVPYVVFRDGEGGQRIVSLPEANDRATIGRAPASDVCLAWDAEVSRVHAQFERLGNDWTVVDDGLSRNGTVVNGDRLRGRHRLRDGDVVHCGTTQIAFRAPPQTIAETAPPAAQQLRVALTDAQRRVLVALCRPYAAGNRFTRPPTNQELADELSLSVETVKTHLRALFDRFGIEDLPHNRKRARLIELALESGTVAAPDLAR